MSWYYASAGKPVGPVPVEEFENLVRNGTIAPQTLVWREGMANWQPWSVASGPPETAAQGGMATPSFAAPPPASPASGMGASQCNAEALVGRDYDSPISSCLSRGRKLFMANFGPMLGAIVLAGIILILVNGIPFIGPLLGLVLNGALIAGMWCYCLRKVRGETASINDLFSGFGPQFVNLLLANLVVGLLSVLCILPGYAILIATFLLRGNGADSGIALIGLVPAGILIFVGWLAMIYLMTCWLFTIPLVADKKIDFWPAMGLSRKMVSKHWWSNFGLLLLFGLVMGLPMALGMGAAGGFAAASGNEPNAAIFVGMILALIVGTIWVVLVAPWLMSSLAYRYEDIFHDLAPGRN